MWPLMILFATVATVMRLLSGGKLKLGFLSLMLWGAAIMAFVDHAIGWLKEGGSFIELTSQDVLLASISAVPVLILWSACLLLKR